MKFRLFSTVMLFAVALILFAQPLSTQAQTPVSQVSITQTPAKGKHRVKILNAAFFGQANKKGAKKATTFELSWKVDEKRSNCKQTRLYISASYDRTQARGTILGELCEQNGSVIYKEIRGMSDLLDVRLSLSAPFGNKRSMKLDFLDTMESYADWLPSWHNRNPVIKFSVSELYQWTEGDQYEHRLFMAVLSFLIQSKVVSTSVRPGPEGIYIIFTRRDEDFLGGSLREVRFYPAALQSKIDGVDTSSPLTSIVISR